MFSRSLNVTPYALFPATVYVTDTLVARPTVYCVSQFCDKEMSQAFSLVQQTTYPFVARHSRVRTSGDG